MNRFIASLLALFAFLGSANAFVTPVRRFAVSNRCEISSTNSFEPKALQRQRKSVAQIQTMGLFGLGAPEIAIILVAAAFLLGPEKLASLGKDAGKIAGELKEVPKEFQKGLEEGEAQAKALKMKEAEKVPEKVPEKAPEKASATEGEKSD